MGKIFNKLTNACDNLIERKILDYTISSGLGYGGWCQIQPRHCRKEMVTRYGLTEIPSASLKQVIMKNIHDSDGTLLFESDDPKSDFSSSTRKFYRKFMRPLYACYCLREMYHDPDFHAFKQNDCSYETLRNWAMENRISTLYIRVSSRNEFISHTMHNTTAAGLKGDIEKIMNNIIKISREFMNG